MANILLGNSFIYPSTWQYKQQGKNYSSYHDAGELNCYIALSPEAVGNVLEIAIHRTAIETLVGSS